MSRGRMIAVFVAVTCVPGITMLWLGSRLLQQDRALMVQYDRDRREQAVDRAVRSLQAAVSDPSLFQALPEAGAALARYPSGPKLFHPEPDTLAEAPADAFREGEEMENRGDLKASAEVYRRIADKQNRALRAGAWLRLARVSRKSRQFADALAAYRELARIDNVAAAGWPATLTAAWGKCAVLEDQHNSEELRRSAVELRRQLDAGRWALNWATYDIFADDAERWTGIPRPRESEMLTQVSNALWERVRRGEDTPDGRRLTWSNGKPVTMVWKSVAGGMAVFAASQAFVERSWLSGIGESVWLRDDNGNPLGDPKSRDFALRYPAETKLPWIVAVSAPSGGDGFNGRRQMLLALLVLVALFTLTGGYFFLRTLRREFVLARMQSDFVSAVSHEFRTPLTSMRMITEALVDDRVPDPQRMRQSFHSLARATQRLHRLVEDLLNFRRMESGALEFRMKSVDATQAVQRVAEEFRREVEHRGFRVSVHTDSGARIRADEHAIARAIWNLLDNAAKYSGESRDIEVSLDRDGSRVRVSVADGGIGIAPDDRDRLFTKFYRGEQARQLEIPGTGIGLAMVAHIAAAHGGRVSVMSEPGRGSTFTMSLPIEESDG